jgi:tetratricopeptide (TPR) repeat protein
MVPDRHRIQLEAWDFASAILQKEPEPYMFQVHPELPGIIVRWFVTTLLKTPGHGPADTLAAAPILNQLPTPGGFAHVKEEWMAARQKDPQAQLWPEVALDIIGSDYQRVGNVKEAIEIFKLNLLAYPNSADAAAYLADRERELARQYTQKALALLDSRAAPASSWSDTESKRDRIRHSGQRTLAQATQNTER